MPETPADFDRDRVMAEMYDELRRAAARLIRRDGAFLTMQPTELVNEAALKVMHLERMNWQDRQHLFATSSRMLRQVMIDAIRRRRADKRQPPTPTLVAGADGDGAMDVEALGDALQRLEAVDPTLAEIVDMRFFVGLTIEEIAGVTGQSARTVKRRWHVARLWLADAMA